MERTLSQLKITATVSVLLALALFVGTAAPGAHIPVLVGAVYCARELLQDEVGDLATAPAMIAAMLLIYCFDPPPHASAASFMVGMSCAWATHANAAGKHASTRFLLGATVGTMTDTLVYSLSSATIFSMGTMQALKWLPVLAVYLILRGREWWTTRAQQSK